MDAAKIWSLNYRLLMSVLGSVASELAMRSGWNPKSCSCCRKWTQIHTQRRWRAHRVCPPTVTVYLKRLESAGFVRRDIDPADLRRHRLTLTPMGRLVMQSDRIC